MVRDCYSGSLGCSPFRVKDCVAMMTPTNLFNTVKPPPFEGCERFARKVGEDKYIVIERRRDSRNQAVFVREEKTFTKERAIANFPDIQI